MIELEQHIEELIKKEKKIIDLKDNERFTFKEIGKRIGISGKTVNTHYLNGKFREELENKGIDINNLTYNKLRELRMGQRGELGAEKKIQLETEILNDLNTEYKLITNYKGLAEKVMRLMNKDKMKKYSKKTQDFCLEIMKKLKEFLEEQIGERRVIIANQD